MSEIAALAPLTRHARERLAARRFSTVEVDYVLENGTSISRTGIEFVVLRRRDVPVEDRAAPVARLEGVTLLVGALGEVITLYRANRRRAVRAVSKKTRYGRHRAA